jgi:hypothetical protein
MERRVRTERAAPQPTNRNRRAPKIPTSRSTAAEAEAAVQNVCTPAIRLRLNVFLRNNSPLINTIQPEPPVRT